MGKGDGDGMREDGGGGSCDSLLTHGVGDLTGASPPIAAAPFPRDLRRRPQQRLPAGGHRSRGAGCGAGSGGSGRGERGKMALCRV